MLLWLQPENIAAWNQIISSSQYLVNFMAESYVKWAHLSYSYPSFLLLVLSIYWDPIQIWDSIDSFLITLSESFLFSGLPSGIASSLYLWFWHSLIEDDVCLFQTTNSGPHAYYWHLRVENIIKISLSFAIWRKVSFIILI